MKYATQYEPGGFNPDRLLVTEHRVDETSIPIVKPTFFNLGCGQKVIVSPSGHITDAPFVKKERDALKTFKKNYFGETNEQH